MAERGLLDLIISCLPDLSYREKISLCEALGDESDLTQKSGIEALRGRARNEGDLESSRRAAERAAEKARARGINMVCWQSPLYPPLLREIYDPPVLLFFRGKLPDPESPLAAVVGTRKPSPASSAQAFDIARGLGRGGISVVSGLAIGIDACAHRGNIEGGAPTVAVLGSGVDEVYPSSNRVLARRILETGGALLSEYPPGMGPRKWTFPARNRIISGLSRGVLIVEAPQKSGALITARFALDQNRDLWVASSGVEHSAAKSEPEWGKRFGFFDKKGTSKLAEDGAGIIKTAWDILGAWNIQAPEFLPSGGPDLAAPLAASFGIKLQLI
ncbi:MAG: DNA-processing protein DprA [Treponema sp.]|jgi:DNA processing protein|nr:DNA-processing protein DprA [Treponema sp.]